MFPTVVRHYDHRNVLRSYGAIEGSQVVEQPDLFGNRLDQGEDLAVFREKIVVRIDQQISGAVQRTRGVRHDYVLHAS
jgi:hypothetical protein